MGDLQKIFTLLVDNKQATQFAVPAEYCTAESIGVTSDFIERFPDGLFFTLASSHVGLKAWGNESACRFVQIVVSKV